MTLQTTITLKYEPHSKQALFHQGRYRYRYRAVFAGVGGGKTLCGLAEGLLWSMENPGSVGYVFEPTYRMVRRILIPTLQSPLLLGKPLEANPYVKAYRVGDNRIDFVNGSVLWFGGLEDPEMAEGPNVDWVHVDEAQYIRKFDEAWDVILRRLRGSGNSTVQGAWVTTTPPPLLPGDRLYEFFEDPEKRNPNSKVYRWSLYDNPKLSRKYIRDIEASHHGNLAKRFIEGRFAPAGTGSFNFDSTIHELKEVDKTMIRQVVYGVDFGWTNPSAIVAVGFDGDDRAYILDEFYQNRVQPEVLIEELLAMYAKYGRGPVYCDRSEPQTIDAFRKAGITAYPDKSKRDDGIHELGGRFHVQGDGKPRIYVLSHCVHWIHEVMVYDADKKENDHAMDATRYALMNRGSEPAWVLR